MSLKGPQILQQRAWQSDLLEWVPRLLEALLAPWPPFLMPFAIVLFIYLFIHLLFFELYLRHMEVPRIGVDSEPQLPASTTATATWDPSCACDLRHGNAGSVTH